MGGVRKYIQIAIKKYNTKILIPQHTPLCVYVPFKRSKELEMEVTKYAEDEEAKKYQEEGHFQQGSMWPKIRSAIHFLKHHGKKVIITNIDNLQDAIDGNAGTIIVKG